ncbi:MAG TPA: hypothetical protein VHN74_04375 [Candidatus Angelobacter sp.]|jgi:hypothetical protein|nr:hypothetical protein [Candidatus Angelobacter sp.]
MKSLGRLVVVCLASLVAAQAPKPETIGPLVKQQFGAGFTLSTKMPQSFVVGDFDSDGVEDVAIVVDSSDPMVDAYDYKYEVADPYNSFFGYGNPNVTASFSKHDKEHSHILLVIFGAGPDAWRATTPKAKFALINVPFDSVSTSRMLVKKNKPPITVIRTTEAEIMDSSVYWDVKKKRWKWTPGDTRDW